MSFKVTVRELWNTYVLPYLVVYFLILGLLFLGLYYLLPLLFPESITVAMLDPLKLLTSALLGAGVFAAILKSFQFRGIFRTEISKVVFDPKFLEKRKDIEEIWRNASKAFYQRTFDQIAGKLENKILKMYFPQSGISYYYDTYCLNTKITLTRGTTTDSTNYLTLEEGSRFVVKGDAGKVIPFHYRTLLERDSEQETATYEVLLVKVNGKEKKAGDDYTVKTEKDKDSPGLRVEFKMDLNDGQSEYEVVWQIKKEYPYSKNRTRTQRTVVLINGIELLLTYDPNDLKKPVIEPLGLTEEIEPLWDNRDGALHLKSNELLFPGQGYKIHFEVK